MKIALGLALLSLTLNLSLGQKRPIQVSYTRDPANSCGQVDLGSGFVKSGMVQYVARPKILESKWDEKQLSIKVFVVSDCCPPDYLGYVEQSDTLILYYGDKKSIPTKNGQPEEVDICMCGHNGCCYEFEYNIEGLNQNVNYLVAVSDVLGIGQIQPYPIGYIDGRHKSVRYTKECDSFDKCLNDKISEALLYYRQLGPLYAQLIDLHTRKKAKEKSMVDQIKKVWIKYFDLREAIYDEFIRSKLDEQLYNAKIDQFEFQVLNELKLLEPKLDITSEYLQGGAFSEEIRYLKTTEKDNE